MNLSSFTSPAGAVTKYCDEYVCLSVGLYVCLCVCVSVCPRGYLRNHTRDLYQFFVHVAYVRGSVLLRHVYDRPHRLSPRRGFLPHWKCIIGRDRGWECTTRTKYATTIALCHLSIHFVLTTHRWPGVILILGRMNSFPCFFLFFFLSHTHQYVNSDDGTHQLRTKQYMSNIRLLYCKSSKSVGLQYFSKI